MYIVLYCMYGAIIFGASTCKTRDIFTLPHYGCTLCINQVLYVAASAITDRHIETETHTHTHTHTHNHHICNPSSCAEEAYIHVHVHVMSYMYIVCFS